MALYLVQHGISRPKEEDPRKGLSDAGREEVRRIAEVAAGYRVRVARIGHSDKTRARQTAEILAAALVPAGGIETVAGIGPLDDAAAFGAGLAGDADRMLVGHLPFMERLCAWLITGQTEYPVFTFQNGGIVCLDTDAGDGRWSVRWALMPRIGGR